MNAICVHISVSNVLTLRRGKMPQYTSVDAEKMLHTANSNVLVFFCSLCIFYIVRLTQFTLQYKMRSIKTYVSAEFGIKLAFMPTHT